MLPLLLAGWIAGVLPVSQETPNRQPQMAVAGNDVVLVFGSGKQIFFTKSAKGEGPWTKPASIAEIPVLPLSRHRGPRIVAAPGALVVTAVGGRTPASGPHTHGLPADGDLLVFRSTDSGVSWSKPAAINDVPAAAREGLHALASDAQGNLAAVWLDLREKGTRLYGSISADGGVTWVRNFLVYESPEGTICQCCHPSLLALGGGEFAVMFRNVLGGNRDLYVTRISGGRVSQPARKAGSGSWSINACPMDGGGMVRHKGKVLTAWRRDQELFLAAQDESETRIAAGKDIALASSGEKLYAIWNEKGEIRALAGEAAQTLSPSGSFPAVLALPWGGAIAAWEENGAVATRKLE